MSFIPIVTALFFALLSTAIIAYISIAAAIGPWIEPTVALMALCFFMVLGYTQAAQRKVVALVTVAGSIGGIMATGVGFSFPTFYFLDRAAFMQMLASPGWFITFIASLSCVSGLFGFIIADIFEHKLVIEKKLAFPVGELVHTIVSAAHQQIRKAYELFAGFFSTLIFCMLQSGTRCMSALIPKHIVLLPALKKGLFIIPTISLPLWPMLWSIGFLAGHLIAVPLAVGAVINSLVMGPLHQQFFASLSFSSFVLAFCGGIILSGVMISFRAMPKKVLQTLKSVCCMSGPSSTSCDKGCFFLRDRFQLFLGCISLVLFVLFFTGAGFSFLAQLYCSIFTVIWIYEAMYQGGTLGLATLGRFATFVMVPAMLLFTITPLQIVIIATFVEVAAGVAVDILFGRKLAQLEGIARRSVRSYQLMGLVFSALCIGAVFWLLVSYIPLGSPELFALKAQNRAALIAVNTFNYYVLGIGILFGFMLKKIHINPSLVIGGILMPLHLSLGLMVGGLATLFVNDKEQWYPLWSGVFVANSLWIVIRAITMFLF